jgi:hypothetical protein
MPAYFLRRVDARADRIIIVPCLPLYGKEFGLMTGTTFMKFALMPSSGQDCDGVDENA